MRSLAASLSFFSYIFSKADFFYLYKNPLKMPPGVSCPRSNILYLQRHEKEHYAFLTKEELPGFLRILETYSGIILVKIAMKLTVLTGVRPGELRKAEWSEFDFEKCIWDVPKEQMKMKRPHLVPLSSQAIALLNQLRPITSLSGLLFPGRNDPKKPMSDMALTVLVRRIGYAGRVSGGGREPGASARRIRGTVSHR